MTLEQFFAAHPYASTAAFEAFVHWDYPQYRGCYWHAKTLWGKWEWNRDNPNCV